MAEFLKNRVGSIIFAFITIRKIQILRINTLKIRRKVEAFVFLINFIHFLHNHKF